jgi:hypothetical protein
MEVRYCDICKEVLKGEVYYIAYQKYRLKSKKETPKYEQMSIEDFQSKLKSVYNNANKIEYREMCQECFKVVERLFSVRIRKLKKIKKELEKMEKQLEKEE